MPVRTLIMLGLTGVAGAALLADKTLLAKGTAAAGTITGLVEDIQKAQRVAEALDEGGGSNVQELLSVLAESGSATPDAVPGGVFGGGSLLDALAGMGAMAELGEAEGGESEAPSRPAAAGPRVTAVVLPRMEGRVGLAMVNGEPMRVGEHRDGITLVSVSEQSVVIAEAAGERVVALVP